jgi:hypothetical protein
MATCLLISYPILLILSLETSSRLSHASSSASLGSMTLSMIQITPSRITKRFLLWTPPMSSPSPVSVRISSIRIRSVNSSFNSETTSHSPSLPCLSLSPCPLSARVIDPLFPSSAADGSQQCRAVEQLRVELFLCRSIRHGLELLRSRSELSV